MKKILSTCLILGFFCATATANETATYVGLEATYNNLKIKGENLKQDFGIKDKNSFSGGLDFGIKANVLNEFYISAELYLNLNSLIDENKTDLSFGDNYSINIKNFFGGRVNFGYNFLENFSGFIFGGLNYLDIESKYDDPGFVFSKKTESKITPSIGLGLAFSPVKNIETKLSYEYKTFKFDHKIMGYELKGDYKVHSIRLGVNYLF